MPGATITMVGVGGSGHVHFHLADPDRLDDEGSEAARPRTGVARRHGQGQAAGMAAGCHRPDEGAALATPSMRMRSPSIAPPLSGDDGSTASTAGRSPASAISLTRCPRGSTLPEPGAPVTPITAAAPGACGWTRSSRPCPRGVVVFHIREQPSQRPPVAAAGPLQQGLGGSCVACGGRSCLDHLFAWPPRIHNPADRGRDVLGRRAGVQHRADAQILEGGHVCLGHDPADDDGHIQL